MKKVAIVLALCAIATISGCGKKDTEQTAAITPGITKEAPAPTAEPTKAPVEVIAGTEVTKIPIEGIMITETPTPKPTEKPTPKPTEKPTSTPEPQEATSKYIPNSGRYSNGSYYVDIVELDAGSFSFSIHNIETGETVSSRTAYFSGHDSTGASGGSFYFDCSGSGSGTLNVSGYDFGAGGSTFWNSDTHQAG